MDWSPPAIFSRLRGFASVFPALAPNPLTVRPGPDCSWNLHTQSSNIYCAGVDGVTASHLPGAGLDRPPYSAGPPVMFHSLLTGAYFMDEEMRLWESFALIPGQGGAELQYRSSSGSVAIYCPHPLSFLLQAHDEKGDPFQLVLTDTGSFTLLGTVLPVFRNCNPLWMRLSKKTLGP